MPPPAPDQTTAQQDAIIVGGGPAGMVLALLLARQNLRVTVLEAAHDFDRSFRGDTLHPATLELMEQLGLIDELLALESYPRPRCPATSGPETDHHARQFQRSCGGKYPYLAVMGQQPSS